MFKQQLIFDTLIFSILTGLMVFMGCSTPDPEGRFNQFQDNTDDRRQMSDAGPIEGQRVDFSGNYLLALATSINPTKPIFIETSVTVDTDANTIDFVFQPVKTDRLPPADTEDREDPRTPAGDPITLTGVPFEEDGSFEADMGEVQVNGDANPITGSDITATLLLNGTVTSATSFCGAVAGDVSAPITADLVGSTFGAVASDDITTAEIVTECESANNNMMDAGTPDADDPDADVPGLPEGRCVPGLAGEYDLFFITDTQRSQGADPTSLTLALSEDEAGCYTGELTSNTDGTTLGTIDYVLEIEGQLEVHANEFIIPPGANPLLPDGGKSTISFKPEHFMKDGMCGTGTMLFSLFEPFALDSDGDFSILRKETDGFTIEGPGCEGITRAEPCGFDSLAGTYDLNFETASGGSTLGLVIEPNDLTCLAGNFTSKIDEGALIGDLVSAEADPDNEGQLLVSFRNFIIAPMVNPLLPDGGTADVLLKTTTIGEGTFCGDITISLFDPFATDSDGTFNAGTIGGNEPVGNECP
jgi:hypothetical protein